MREDKWPWMNVNGEPPLTLQLLDCDVIVGVDADYARDLHRLFSNFASAQICVVHQGAGGGGGVAAPGTDRRQRFVGVDNVARAGDEKCLRFIGNKEQGLEVAQHLVSAPILGQFDRGPVQV